MEQAIEALGTLAGRLERKTGGKAKQEPASAQRLHAARAYGKGFR